MITLDQFKEIEIKVGLVTEAVNAENSEKLIRLTVDFKEKTPRIIFTGVRPFGFTPEDFVNKKFLFVTNLEPRKMVNDEYSQGMILAVDPPAATDAQALRAGGSDNKPIFVKAEDMPVGAKVR